MNFFTKIHELLRQKEQIVKKPRKHDANLQKNSTLYFQVGLIICLLATNGLFEMYFKTTANEPYVYEDFSDDTIYVPDLIVKTKEVAMIKPEPIVRRPITRIENPIVKKNDYVTKPIEPVITATEVPDVNPPVTTPQPSEPPKEIGPRNILGVEEVPIFPGCEGLGDNQKRIKCMSDKLAKIVQRKFNGDLAADQGLEGVQRISVQFTIDKTGSVTDIKARAPHFSLEKEAKRVMTKVPKMQPGKQSDKPVDVVYSLPIIFRVQN